MVLQRKLDFGFNGYQVPEVPRASRSARGRRSIWQKHEGNQIHAFEILANVAGELLQESSEHSLVSSVSCEKDEHNIVEDIFKTNRNNKNKQSNEDSCKDGSFDKKKTIYNVIQSQGHDYEKHSLNGSTLHAKDKISFQTNSTTKDSNQSGMTSITSDSRNACGDSLFFPEVIQGNVNGVLERKLEAELTNIGNTNIKDKNVNVTSSLDDLMKLDKESPNLVCSVHDVPESLTEVVSKDNDEKSPGSVQSSTRTITFKPQPDIENSNVMTPSATKHWEVSTDVKYESYSKIAGEVKDPNQNGKDCSVDEKSQRIYPFKKRKFFNYEGIYDSPAKRMINGKNCNSAIGASSLKSGLQLTKSKDCNVKLSIKSFRVPELFIEIPTTATIGLLKRTVMDAVTAVLGDGLHVGILCQGKKVRDDDKTLLQTGISRDVKHNSFSFVLEPKHVNTVPSCTSNPSFPAVSTSQALNRHSTSLMLRRGTSNVSKRPPRKELDCSVGDDIGLIPTPIDTSNAKPNSQALVAVPAVGMQPLAVVSYHRKSRHPEYVQRRIRRPFSVSEVEALVQAVEKIGTGRWRDVKLRAFDTAKHRTYVDLKDKWKTLVHTARISPQQRRGEPVPQELLDRVLSAQAYWSHRQSKQQARSAS